MCRLLQSQRETVIFPSFPGCLPAPCTGHWVYPMAAGVKFIKRLSTGCPWTHCLSTMSPQDLRSTKELWFIKTFWSSILLLGAWAESTCVSGKEEEEGRSEDQLLLGRGHAPLPAPGPRALWECNRLKHRTWEFPQYFRPLQNQSWICFSFYSSFECSNTKKYPQERIEVPDLKCTLLLQLSQGRVTLTDALLIRHNPQSHCNMALEQLSIISRKQFTPSHITLSFCTQKALDFSPTIANPWT